ncbi:CheB methylesterase domain-containing protein [uncultured Marinococcus sp.]|jgi:two-component system chemotaxis response regulator CheB|uniref:CheB methylesterase domain-containing protein n=1 Tax=uncultured Marinococcus sp. TaxID=487012 RepID=UPI0026369F13|nr:CheB methylesterase domain-containing protein [uncultured Marinococcus sp.]
MNIQPSGKPGRWDLLVIGTSTGGPAALQKLFHSMPEEVELPIVIVQHMPSGFTRSLADRLNRDYRWSVKEAEDGGALQKGTVYIAPGGRQLEIRRKGNRLITAVNESETGDRYHPSMDLLLASLFKLGDLRVLAVILTGMGSDGTCGLKKLQAATALYAVAESEETAVVYGMPRAAVQAGVIDEVLPLHAIGERIGQLVQTTVYEGEVK